MTGADHFAREVSRAVSERLDRLGLLYRVFHRAKSLESLRSKIDRYPGKYAAGAKLVQDGVGVRVAVYFMDDVSIVRQVLKSLFTEVECVEDVPEIDTFGPVRLNLVFRLASEYAGQLKAIYQSALVDDTFEVQIRTILSEGWHEVEHDLRYKASDDWSNSGGLSRAMNGVMASLEICDWTMLRILDELAHRNYMDRKWEAMLRAAYRLRLQNVRLHDQLSALLDSDHSLSRAIFKADRNLILCQMISNGTSLPLTPSNLIYVINHYVIHHDEVARMTPPIIRAQLQASPATEIETGE